MAGRGWEGQEAATAGVAGWEAATACRTVTGREPGRARRRQDGHSGMQLHPTCTAGTAVSRHPLSCCACCSQTQQAVLRHPSQPCKATPGILRFRRVGRAWRLAAAATKAAPQQQAAARTPDNLVQSSAMHRANNFRAVGGRVSGRLQAAQKSGGEQGRADSGIRVVRFRKR